MYRLLIIDGSNEGYLIEMPHVLETLNILKKAPISLKENIQDANTIKVSYESYKLCMKPNRNNNIALYSTDGDAEKLLSGNWVHKTAIDNEFPLICYQVNIPKIEQIKRIIFESGIPTERKIEEIKYILFD